MPRASTSPNRTRSSPGATEPSAALITRGSASARKDVWRNSTSGPSQAGGPWISSIISMPRPCIRWYSSSMSSTRGVRWLTCVVVTPAMSAATPETAESSSYHGWSIGSGDSANAAVARSRKRPESAGDRPPSASDRSASSSSAGGNSVRAPMNRCTRACSSASKNRRSSGTSTEVKTRNGLLASSSRSTGRNAVDTTGSGVGSASRKS